MVKIHAKLQSVYFSTFAPLTLGLLRDERTQWPTDDTDSVETRIFTDKMNCLRTREIVNSYPLLV